MSEARILILGGGVAGLATAWYLARRGARDVVLLEREALLGTHSSGRNAAILRTLIPDPEVRRLAREGARFLERPPADFCEAPLVDRCGLLLVADGEAEADLEAWTALGGGEVELIELDARRLAELAPHYGGPQRGGLLAPGEGRMDIAELLRGFEHGAREGGVEIRAATGGERLIVEGGAVRGARLDDGSELRAPTTVLAAGGWAGRLAREAGSRVTLLPTRRHLMVTAPLPEVDPAWPVLWTLGDEFYARPESGGLMLCACDQVPVDPDHCDVDPDVREAIAVKTARHLPRFADAGVAHFWSGMRTHTPDGRFAIGPDGELEGLFWVAGLGGHGMVCAAGVGRLACELLLDPDSGDPARAAFDPARLVPVG